MDVITPPGPSERDPVPVPRPRVWRESFQSHDLDETRAYIGGKFGDRSRVPRAGEGFYYAHLVAESERAAVGTMSTTVMQTMHAAVHVPTLYLPLRGTDHYRIGRRTLVSNPCTAVLLAPGHDYTCHSQPNEWIGVTVASELLSEEIAAVRRGRSRAWRFKSAAINLTPGRTAELLEMHRRMQALSVAPALAADDAVASTEGDVAAWLAGLVVEQAGEVRLAERTLRRLDRLERWVDAHLGEEVTLDRLCAASGVCPRVLQKAVLALRGQSPLEWVRSRRLAAVRARLLAGSARTNISQVALDLGFTHLGRFSALYRRAYGELPSATLGQAQARGQARHGVRPGRSGPLRA